LHWYWRLDDGGANEGGANEGGKSGANEGGASGCHEPPEAPGVGSWFLLQLHWCWRLDL